MKNKRGKNTKTFYKYLKPPVIDKNLRFSVVHLSLLASILSLPMNNVPLSMCLSGPEQSFHGER